VIEEEKARKPGFIDRGGNNNKGTVAARACKGEGGELVEVY